MCAPGSSSSSSSFSSITTAHPALLTTAGRRPEELVRHLTDGRRDLGFTLVAAALSAF
ncbi:hypothetical protein AB5J49_11705 [Streptomyces sp. R28]|uniref:Uncharacterized protein n=1 Tax=Streptomyces sp. R28 TaxID=3238628 RepID=A0AB39PT90_9ACTN